MPPSTPPRFRLFRTLFAIELVVYVCSALFVAFALENDQGGAILGVIGPFIAFPFGCVVAVVGSIAKPRQPLMLMSLALHALALVALVIAQRS